jgi:hypothetical protein
MGRFIGHIVMVIYIPGSIISSQRIGNMMEPLTDTGAFKLNGTAVWGGGFDDEEEVEDDGWEL